MAGRAISKAALFKKIGYSPHAGQIDFHNSSARFRLANCGRRFGKSTMAARDLEPKLFLPDRNYWIVAPTYDLGEKEFRVVWQDLILGQKLGQAKDIKKAYNKKQGNMYVQFPWNTRLEVRTADHPENLVGDSLDWVIMSEAAKHKEDTWERYIRPALADRHGGADFPTTPEGYNWLYDLWMRGQDDTYPEWASWKFPSWMNTEVFPGGYDDPEIVELRRGSTPEAFIQEIGADFGSFVGKIYHTWDVEFNVRNLRYNPAWPNYIAFDWGFTNPLAAIEFQVDPQDRVYVWREHYKAYMTLTEHVRMMKAREQPDYYRIDCTFGDAADPEQTLEVNQLFAPCISDPLAKSNWREGVDLVSQHIRREVDTDEHGGPVYEAALFVDPSCKNTIHEFNNYKAPPGSNGRNAPEAGLKQDDHALDALRYGLMHVFKLGATRHLYETMSDGLPPSAYRSEDANVRNFRTSGFSPAGSPTKGPIERNTPQSGARTHKDREEEALSGSAAFVALNDYYGTESSGYFSLEGGRRF